MPLSDAVDQAVQRVLYSAMDGNFPTFEDMMEAVVLAVHGVAPGAIVTNIQDEIIITMPPEGGGKQGEPNDGRTA